MKALVLKTNLFRPKKREISNILGLQNLYTGNLFLDYAIRLIIFLLFFFFWSITQNFDKCSCANANDDHTRFRSSTGQTFAFAQNTVKQDFVDGSTTGSA